MKINKGDKMRLTTENEILTRIMNVNIGDELTVQDIDEDNNVFLIADDNRKSLVFDDESIWKYCEKVEDEDVYVYEVDDEDFDHIASILSKSEFKVLPDVFGKCTIVACRLPNGFVIVESSSCVNPDDYDEDIGIENCMNRIKNKVIEMEAYVSCIINNKDDWYDGGDDDGCGCRCGECKCLEEDEDDEDEWDGVWHKMNF